VLCGFGCTRDCNLDLGSIAHRGRREDPIAGNGPGGGRPSDSRIAGSANGGGKLLVRTRIENDAAGGNRDLNRGCALIPNQGCTRFPLAGTAASHRR
jgi:hypothetical protein